MAIATGVLDKAVAAIYEVRRRPAEKVHEPWRQHLLIQATGGLKALEAHKQNPWMLGDFLTLADISAGVTVSFLRVMLPELVPADARSEEHTSELQSLMRISYAVFCLKKKKNKQEEKNG